MKKKGRDSQKSSPESTVKFHVAACRSPAPSSSLLQVVAAARVLCCGAQRVHGHLDGADAPHKAHPARVLPPCNTIGPSYGRVGGLRCCHSRVLLDAYCLTGESVRSVCVGDECLSHKLPCCFMQVKSQNQLRHRPRTLPTVS